MRILNAVSALSGGGAERQFMYLAPELVNIGHEVEVAYLYDGPSGSPHLLTQSGILLHKLSSTSNYNPLLLWELVALIRFIKPDLVQTWSIQMDVLAGFAARITHVPYVLREPNCSDCYNNSWKNKIRLFIGSHSDAIVSNSGGGDDYWKHHVPSNKRYIIHNGLPIERVMQATSTSLPKIGLDANRDYILYAGRLEPGKNLLKLIEALKIVMASHDINAVFCGDGSSRQTLDDLVKSLGIESKVHFLGHVQNEIVWGLMKNATAFVFVSEFEGMPNVVVEAMACGSPLIVSDIKAHKDILDESMALIVDPLNTKSIANAIINVLQDPTRAKERAASAKSQALHYSISAMADSYLQVYHKLLTSEQTHQP